MTATGLPLGQRFRGPVKCPGRHPSLWVTTEPAHPPGRIRLANVRAGHHVKVTQGLSVEVASGRIGAIEFDLAESDRGGECTFAGEAARLHATHGAVNLADAVIGEVVLSGGTVRGDTSVAVGDVSLPQSVRRLSITAEGATIDLKNRPKWECLELPTESGQEPCLRLRDKERSSRSLPAQHVTGSGHLELENVDLVLTSVDGELTISGTGAVRVAAGATVTDLTLQDSVRLEARPGAALLRFSGQLRVGSCKHVTIVSRPGGSYEYVGLARGQHRPPTPEALAGATLRCVVVPDDASGRQRLQELRQAAVVEPRVDELRVFTPKWRTPFARRRLTADTPSTRALDDAAFFAEVFAGLVTNKCGAGSIRTKASWAAYRGRHLNAESSWERAALGLYRLVGYGQRPGPPAALWPILALLLTPVGLWLSGWPEESLRSGTFWLEAAEQALSVLLSPLFLLRLAGDPQLAQVTQPADLFVMLIRTAVAAPFVFFVLATARFLRAEWPW